jgi:hypothetical protein
MGIESRYELPDFDELDDAQQEEVRALKLEALLEGGLPEEALETWQRGMAVAEARGDLQAAKEMQVFARRLEKTLGAG